MELAKPEPVADLLKKYASKRIGLRYRVAVMLFLILAVLFPTPSNVFPAAATEPSSVTGQMPAESSESWYDGIQTEWGGRIRLLGRISRHDTDTIFAAFDEDPFYDGTGDVRLKNDTYFSRQTSFTIHYEAVWSGGDTRQTAEELTTAFPDLLDNGLLSSDPPADDRRFFDLTRTIHEDADSVFYHRLDRLAFTWQPAWGMVSIGRQAVTWGNGFLFNPFDLFNPFAPTDIIRDYKVGDDMINVQLSTNDIGDFQLLYVARRDPANDKVEFSDASLAGKWHVAVGTTEFDVLAAEHFDDAIVGFGSRGYLADAAWRLDATWTFLEEDDQHNGFLSVVANMDYAWVWGKRNFYGFIELYFNGLGDEDYTEAIRDPAILERLDRGEIFTLGRTYLALSTQIELHPLLNLFLTSINNAADPSGFFQSYAVWNIHQDLELTLGGIVYYGGSDTEFGGFTIPGTEFRLKGPHAAFLWLTYYF